MDDSSSSSTHDQIEHFEDETSFNGHVDDYDCYDVTGASALDITPQDLNAFTQQYSSTSDVSEDDDKSIQSYNSRNANTREIATPIDLNTCDQIYGSRVELESDFDDITSAGNADKYTIKQKEKLSPKKRAWKCCYLTFTVFCMTFITISILMGYYVNPKNRNQNKSSEEIIEDISHVTAAVTSMDVITSQVTGSLTSHDVSTTADDIFGSTENEQTTHASVPD